MEVDALIKTRPRSFESNHRSIISDFPRAILSHRDRGMEKGARRRESIERDEDTEFVRGYDHWLNVVLAERCLLARNPEGRRGGDRRRRGVKLEEEETRKKQTATAAKPTPG